MNNDSKMTADEQATSANTLNASPCTNTSWHDAIQEQEHERFPVATLMDLGHGAAEHHHYSLASTYFREAITSLQDEYQATADHAPSSAIEYELGMASSYLGGCSTKLGLLEGAVSQYQQALHYKRLYYNYCTRDNKDIQHSSSYDKNVSARMSHTEIRNINLDLAVSIENVAEALILVGDYKNAERLYHEALDIKRLIYNKEQHQQSQHQYETRLQATATNSVLNLSSVPSLDKIKHTVYGYDLIQNTDIANTYVHLGTICQYLRQFHKARKYYTSALAMYRTVYSNQHDPDNGSNALLFNNYQHQIHGDKLDTFDIVRVKSLRCPKSKLSAKASAMDDKPQINNVVRHIDIVKVLAQLGVVNEAMNKHDYANLYFDKTICMIQYLIDHCNGNDKKKMLLYTTTYHTIQQERLRCVVSPSTSEPSSAISNATVNPTEPLPCFPIVWSKNYPTAEKQKNSIAESIA
jgi:tetratricopeptide (TPR) repeat protein